MKKDNKGSALITLLIFVATGIIIIGGAVAVSVINTQGTSKFSQGEIGLHIAEGGIEDSLIKVLRDPSYTATNDTLTVGDGTATINITGTTSKTVTVSGKVYGLVRKIQVTGDFTSDQFNITDWQEVD
jgi:type II secretory pathway component PulK